MELSCPIGIRALSRKENLSSFGVLFHVINPLLTKLFGLVLFLRVYGARLTSVCDLLAQKQFISVAFGR